MPIEASELFGVGIQWPAGIPKLLGLAGCAWSHVKRGGCGLITVATAVTGQVKWPQQNCLCLSGLSCMTKPHVGVTLLAEVK